MGKLFKRLIHIIVVITAFPALVFAQSDSTIEMADSMRSEGKIYVVILVVAIVFTGLVIFAINSDRKISKLEKEVNSLKSGQDL